MNKLAYATVATLALTGLGSVPGARAADLPTKKELPPPAKVNCYSGFWTWLDSTAADCPLSWGPFTAYATLDLGFGYNTNGTPWSPTQANGTGSFINKEGYGTKWLWTQNALSQSVIGIKVSQPIGMGWSLVGTAETGFSPLSWNLANGQRSLVQNNGQALLLQSYNSDSSRNGQWDNSQGFLGFSNPTYGTIVAGRVNSIALDGLISYDPMGSAYAFSPFGFSGSYAGFGDTETTRSNTAVKYRVDVLNNYRFAFLGQFGGYDQGNGATELWQAQIGGDFKNLFNLGGTLSLDGIYSYAQNAVNLSNFAGTCTTFKSGALKGETACSSGIPKFYDATDLKATLSNNTGVMLLAKYKQGPLTISGGYAWIRQANPSDTFQNGFETAGGYNVPATIPANLPGAKAFPTQWVTTNAYNINRHAPFFFFGAKYAVTPQLDVAGAFYYLSQNNYNSSTTPCAYANTTFVQPNGHNIVVSRMNSSSCAGSQDAYSFLIDYRPVKRVDLYAGIMISNVYAGLANGFPATQNIAPTAGLRVKF
jgi:predicted porin